MHTLFRWALFSLFVCVSSFGNIFLFSAEVPGGKPLAYSQNWVLFSVAAAVDDIFQFFFTVLFDAFTQDVCIVSAKILR